MNICAQIILTTGPSTATTTAIITTTTTTIVLKPISIYYHNVFVSHKQKRKDFMCCLAQLSRLIRKSINISYLQRPTYILDYNQIDGGE